MPAAMRRLFGTPVPLTIDGSARPERAASSCIATAADAPSRSSSWRSSQSIGRRDTQVSPAATSSSSSMKPIAEVPPPTTTTCLSRKSSEPT